MTDPADAMFKPGYEGERLATTTTGPERQALRLARGQLIRRLFDAMMTMTVQPGRGGLGLAAGGTPAHIVEFSDRVGEEKADPNPIPFRPTAAMVSDMGPALALLEGLRPAFFQVVFLRAVDDYARYCGDRGPWPWAAIGGKFGMSDRWAEAAFDAAIVQAARRAGILPKVSTDYAVLVASSWVERGWMTNISTAADPRQALSNLRGKSPVRIEDAYAIWVAGQPVAKRVAEEVRKSMKNLCSHGSWYRAHPDIVSERLIEIARSFAAGWVADEIALRGANAPGQVAVGTTHSA